MSELPLLIVMEAASPDVATTQSPSMITWSVAVGILFAISPLAVPMVQLAALLHWLSALPVKTKAFSVVLRWPLSALLLAAGLSTAWACSAREAANAIEIRVNFFSYLNEFN